MYVRKGTLMRFFKESSINSDESHDSSSDKSSDENEFDFTPLKNDESDKHTQELFVQLENGADQYTNIYVTVKDGANLYARKAYSKYKNCLPIHIAAYNVGCNTEAISSLLATFDNPEDRKKYIYLKDDSDRNALEILIEDSEFEEIAMPSIKSILSYLTANEQRHIMSYLSKKSLTKLDDDESPVSREEDIENLSELNYFFKQNKTINVCQQRRKEESNVLAAYESDEESLGKLESVYNKKFTAKVSYKDTINNGVVNSIPELILIPSDWRLETAMQDNTQGDHVTAYVLLLSTFAHCKGENVKKLPELVYNLAVDVLPDDKNLFLQKKEKVDEVLTKYRKIRTHAIASLTAECDKEKAFISEVENNLKKAEIEAIANHIEDSIDVFLKNINKLADESFSHKRKQSITGSFILQQLALILEKIDFLNEKQYQKFRAILIDAVRNEAKQTNSGVTDKTLERIADTIRRNDLTNIRIPSQLLSKSFKLTKTSILEFLKMFTPLKKYHEGYVIKDIKVLISSLEKSTDKTERSELLNRIGFLCSNLFDYPRVNDDNMNDEYVLYQAIPRHFIIINSAFSHLKRIPPNEKEIIYDVFLNKILILQLWGSHFVLDNNQEIKRLEINLLKERILKFANLDLEHNLSMKITSEHPKHLRISDINDKKDSTKKTLICPRKR